MLSSQSVKSYEILFWGQSGHFLESWSWCWTQLKFLLLLTRTSTSSLEMTAFMSPIGYVISVYMFYILFSEFWMWLSWLMDRLFFTPLCSRILDNAINSEFKHFLCDISRVVDFVEDQHSSTAFQFSNCLTGISIAWFIMWPMNIILRLDNWLSVHDLGNVSPGII